MAASSKSPSKEQRAPLTIVVLLALCGCLLALPTPAGLPETGKRVIAVTSSDERAAFVRAQGADEIIDRTRSNVVEETLRLTPALYFLPRRSTVHTWIELGDRRKMFIPKGTQVWLDVWHANRCEDFWGKAVTGYPAEEFAPARWQVLAQKGIVARDMLHFGFGHGPRFCPGRYLGLLEVGLVVGAVVKIFKFSAVDKSTSARAGVSTKPDDGLLVDLEIRA